MSQRNLAGGLAVTLLVIVGTAAGDCNGVVCVDARESGDRVELYIRNGSSYPVTATLSTRTHNLRMEAEEPIILTLAGGQRRLAAELHEVDESRQWRYRYWHDWAYGRRNAEHGDVLYRLPYAEGERYRVLQGFNGHFSHQGLERYTVDFDMPVGTAVHAARDGVVVDVKESSDRGGWEDHYADDANYIVVLHDDGTTGEYYHLEYRGALVERGDRVTAGQLIGRSGNTGHTAMPHLHFGVYRPVEWGRTQSVPFRFKTRRGVVEHPRRWRAYRVAD